MDARNPLMFRSADLERYVKEVDQRKLSLILCNKADYLTSSQRRTWAKYFDSIGVVVVFFSALNSSKNCEEVPEEVLICRYLFSDTLIYVPTFIACIILD